MPSEAPARRIVAYGTSLTARWTWRLWRRTGGHWVRPLRAGLRAQTDPRLGVENAARWGSDSTWGLRCLERRVLGRRPHLLLLEFAINDADRRRGISIGRSRSQLSRMLDEVASACPACQVVLLTMSPALGRHAVARPELDAYYELYREAARERGLHLVDLNARWCALPEDGLHRALPDGIHPTPEACRTIVVPELISTLSPLLTRAPA